MYKITDIKKLGSLIRKTRKFQGITQEQLSASAGIGIRFIRELEQGKGSCQVGKAIQVMQTLGMILLISLRDDGAGFGGGSGSGEGNSDGTGFGGGSTDGGGKL